MLLRDALGGTLRHARMGQSRTLRDVSTVANVSLGYLSEVERGRKEASSELLAAICDALDLQVADVLNNASTAMRVASSPAPMASTRSSTSLRIVMPYRAAPSAPSIV